MTELVRTAERDSDDHSGVPAAWPCGAALIRATIGGSAPVLS